LLHSKYHVFSKTPKIFNYYNPKINIEEVVVVTKRVDAIFLKPIEFIGKVTIKCNIYYLCAV